jgi:hypothetical protein
MNDKNYLDIKACMGQRCDYGSAKETKDPILDAIELLNYLQNIIQDCESCKARVIDKKC